MAAPELIEILNPDSQAWMGGIRDSNVVGMVRALHLAHALLALEETGIAAKLLAGGAVPQDVLVAGLDTELAGHFLRYMEMREIVKLDAGRVQLTETGRKVYDSTGPITTLRFYLRGYGPVVAATTDLLRGGKTYGKDVVRDGVAVGGASAETSRHLANHLIFRRVRSLGARCVLDVGCGGGAFLIDLCRHDPDVRGIGLDISAPAIEAARREVEREGLASRIQFVVGDGFRPETWPSLCDEADVVVASQVLHEATRHSQQPTLHTLQRFAERLRSGGLKALLIYENRFSGRWETLESEFFLLHALSQQGFPLSPEGWVELFSQAGLRCREILHEKNTRFVVYDLAALPA
jgi:SAM-dependent methyltransferase